MLSEEDQASVNALLGLAPDQEVTSKYIWDEDFQRVIIAMLLCDKYFITQSLNLIKSTYFSNEIHQLIYRKLIEYFEKHRQQPSKIFLKQLLIDSLREKHQNQSEDTFETSKLLYLGELNTLYDYYSKGGVGDMMPALDSPDAVLDRIEAFAKSQAIKFAFHRCLDLVRKNPESDATWTKVDEMLKEARLVERQVDLGLNYFETVEERYERVEKVEAESEVFTSGFESIDRAINGNGLTIGEIGAWMGLPASGKSLCLVTGAVKNVLKNKKVLYISTEMDQDRIAARFDAQIALIGQHQLTLRKDEVFSALRDTTHDYEDKRRLIIKQFPSGSADVNTVKAYHAQLAMYGFDPDLVIVDYIGDMKDIPNIPTWESKFRMLRDLRGFGKVEKHCTFTAIQPNRGATDLGLEEFLDESQQGGSFMQNQVLDAFWTLNQTSTERKAGVGRVYVSKHRNGKSRFYFKINYNYEPQTLNIQEISDDFYRNAMSRVKETQSEEVHIEGLPSGKKKNKKFQPGEGELQ